MENSIGLDSSKLTCLPIIMTKRAFSLLQKVSKRPFLSCSDNKMAFGNMVYSAGKDHLAKQMT